MSLRKETPCDFGPCPYSAEYSHTCEYYCGEPEPEEDFEYQEDEFLEVDFNPYMGCYDYED